MRYFLCKKSTYRISSIKRRTPIKRRPRLNAGSKLLIFKQTPGAFVRGPGVYLRRANKYRYSLEKHCYDTYCTVYCFFYFNKLLQRVALRHLQGAAVLREY